MLTWKLVVYLLVILFCDYDPASAQLGESKTAKEILFSLDDPPEDEKHLQHDVIYDDEIVDNEEAEMIEFRPKNWKPVIRTYQGCLAEQHMMEGTFLYVNLSSVVDNQDVTSEAEACYELCFHHDPFSMYISLNLGLEGDNDACGCHDQEELQLDDMVEDDKTCDLNNSLSRIYCGPENVQCYSTASLPTMPALQFILLLLAFITTFLHST